METGSIQGAWGTHAEGWSQEACSLIEKGSWSKATSGKYQTYLQHLLLWCQQAERPFPFGGTKEDVATMADYLEDKTKSLSQPGSTIKILHMATNNLASALNIRSPMDDPAIAKLCNTIVEQRTARPMISCASLDPRVISDFWRDQPDNTDLTPADLRAKTLSLLCITKFLRPNDAAKLNRNLMHWNEDQSKCTFVEWGYKNNKALQGNAGFVPTHSNPKVCPLFALRDYLLRTRARETRIRETLLQEYKQQNADISKNRCRPFAPFVPLFLDLDRDKGLAAHTCSRILKDVIKRAGADPDIFTAGSFCHGSADAVLAGRMKPEHVCEIGKWGSQQVFFQHYTATRVPKDYAEQLLGCQSPEKHDKEWEEREDSTDSSDAVEGTEQEWSDIWPSEDECSSSN